MQNKNHSKGRTFVLFSFIAVLIVMTLLIGGFIALFFVNSFIQSNDYVLCNVYDLEKANKVLYADEPTYENLIKVNFTQGVIINGNS